MIPEAPPGWRLQEHDTLHSTQDAAIAAARAGAADRLAILAREQTGGRGCHGKAWASLRGNLNLSVVLQRADRREQMGMWSLLAGVAVHEAVGTLAGRDGLTLKWPNDLMLGGAKLGGILIESAIGDGHRADWVVIGIGVNVEQAPSIEGRATACLGGSVPARALAIETLRQIGFWSEAGDEAIRLAWLSRAHPVGTRLMVSSPRRDEGGNVRRPVTCRRTAPRRGSTAARIRRDRLDRRRSSLGPGA